jgi:hypothetical protein
MCSKPGGAGHHDPPPADLAARLGRAIEELAATAGQDDPACPELAERLASAWAMITAADPELAARTARYSPH